MTSVLYESGVAPEEIVDMLADGDWLREYLRENKLRPEDVKDAAADRGKEEHLHLEMLAKKALHFDGHEADELARHYRDSKNGWRRATGNLWLDLQPQMVASEQFLYNLAWGYAGTADALTTEGVADLKSRGAKKVIYESDHVQAGAYALAARGNGFEVGPHRSIWLIREDGSYTVESDMYDEDLFLDILNVYRKLRKGVN
jgi:hypothetical protein